MKQLVHLQTGQCKYPAAQDEDGVHLFCAEAVGDLKDAYCRAHAALCYTKPVKPLRIKRNFTFVPIKLRHATHDCET